MPKNPSKFSLPPHPVLTRYYDDEMDRKKKVKSLFDSSAIHYDWINSIMSLGTGERYRLEALHRAGLTKGQSVLDTGCGTGVLARHELQIVGDTGSVLGVDPSYGMLKQALQRGVKQVLMGRGECLPLADRQFDFVSMAYALRHVANLGDTFDEYLRVLKPGGTLLLLEISPPVSRLGYSFIKFYMKHIIPLITRLGTRDKNAQQLMSYYWDTVDQCVPPSLILEALEGSGFIQVKRRIIFGIFSEYTALRPEVEALSNDAG